MSDPRPDTRLAQWGALAGGLAHEIKNPLSTISLTLQLLREDLTSRETIPTAQPLARIETLIAEAAQLERILEDFLRVAREPTIHADGSDLNAVVEDTLRFLDPELRERRIDLVLQLDRSVTRVEADQTLIRQTLLNLLRNAVQAMGEGGTLTVQTRGRGSWFEIEVIDTGSGMTPEVLARIFDGFYSTKSKGTGIGLTIARRNVELHGGELLCESEAKRGSRFTVRLPLRAGRTEGDESARGEA